MQEAINKLQHEYKRLSQVMLFDGTHDNCEVVDEIKQSNGGGFSASEQKLAKLCVRNRKCLSRVSMCVTKVGGVCEEVLLLGNAVTYVDCSNMDQFLMSIHIYVLTYVLGWY